jgi:hypothetical protein
LRCLLLTQSGHSVLRIVAAQNASRTPFRLKRFVADPSNSLSQKHKI